ncbi:MAG: biopolymer transporter ExbD [Prevotella sp.]|jgi:biopolymer transport protein ExbD|nr:biopolymer transporter ExbD [Prevotella sp.]MBR7087138.1 biopolymer transporter ExbD [Prevotella sp.]
MGKVKIKKQDVWIDMTPMSDVMVLLLTFFMMTSTFVKNEPAKVLTPSSVSEIKVPEKDALTILVDSVGKVFMGMDNQGEIREVLSEISGTFGISLNPQQQANFLQDAMWGVPVENLDEYLKLDVNAMNKYIQSDKNEGIPLDSIDGGMSQFQHWVKAARGVNDDLKIIIKGDQNTPYKTIKRIMNELRDINENRYYLATSLKASED